jgi:hypothetical protein
MIRRRRRSREIPFSFDSFLDVVANVVGIIIRLILVVWVGARSYGSLQDLAAPPEEPPAAVVADDADAPLEPDPLTGELAAERRQLAEAEAALRAELAKLDLAREKVRLTDRELEQLAERRAVVTAEGATIERGSAEAKQAVQATALSGDELRERLRRLTEEIKAVQAQSSAAKKVLRYRTPVSKPVEAEELQFECRMGRVTFIDVGALVDEIKRGMRAKGEELRSSWEVSDVVGPIGPFQLRYTLERERDSFPGATPDAVGSYRYGLSAWYVEPVTEVRGETLEQALKPGSEFRQIADGLDPQYAAVTFWVYPDSFPLYRWLRDYLYDRDLVVAGRPLPSGAKIASTRHGTVSRGQ